MALKKPSVTDTAELKEESKAAAVETETKVEPAADPEPEVETKPEPTVETEPEVEVEVDQPEAEVDEPAKEAVEQTKEVAVQTGTTSVAAARSGAMASFTQDMADKGFEDLELTGFSFDRIKLHEGQFKHGSDETELGESFQCIIHSTRGVYVVRQSSDEDAELFFSYDPKGLTHTDGTSAEEKLSEWRDEGYGTEENPVDIKKYLEVMVTIVDCAVEDLKDTMASLSIPPASRDRLAGLAAQAKQKFRVDPDGVVTECRVGKKVGEGKKAFRPWTFKALRVVG